MSKSNTRAFFVSVGLFVLVGAILGFSILKNNHKSPAAQETAATGDVAIGGDYTLVNQHGKTVSSKDFRGRYQLVFFGFTHCPDVCPTTLGTITQSLISLGKKADRFVPVFISVDPERDTPQVMAEYAKAFYPSLQALTGSPENITGVSKEFGVYASREEPKDQQVASDDHEHHASDAPMHGSYTVDHSDILYIMDRDGHYLDHFSSDVTPDQLTARLNKLLEKGAGSGL